MGYDQTDKALQRLGKWGRWQISYYTLISVAVMWPACSHMLAIAFIGGVPDHRCKVPDNHTYLAVRECEVVAEVMENGSWTNSTPSCPDGFEYYGDVGETIVSQWNLVCSRDYLAETSQTVMVFGILIGAMLFTNLSDNFGRKPIFLFSEWAMVVVGIITAFSFNYYFFLVLRFCAGALQQGIILTGFVMACELFPGKMRTFAGLAIELFWAVAMCILALLAYLIRDWRYLQLTISIPAALTVGFFWILPESIPWLVANNRIPEAEVILHKAADCNKVSLPESCLSPLDLENDPILKDNEKSGDGEKTVNPERRKSILDKLRPKKPTDTEHIAKYTLLDVVRSRLLLTYSIIMCLLWFVNSLVYFGLSLSTAALAGDRYLNFFLSGLVEIPAYASSIFLLEKFGRRWPLVVFHIVAGVSLALTLAIPENITINDSNYDLRPLIITLNMIGKFGITGSFGIVFLYAPEIFPTTIRAQAMGIASVGGRLGNMMAPYSSLVARKVPWLPGILFGALSIAVGMLALLLPETLNRPLPNTIEDIQNWKKSPQTQVANADIEMKNNTKA